MNKVLTSVVFAGLFALAAPAAEKVWMDELPLDAMTCGKGSPKAKLSVDGKPLTVNGKV